MGGFAAGVARHAADLPGLVFEELFYDSAALHTGGSEDDDCFRHGGIEYLSTEVCIREITLAQLDILYVICTGFHDPSSCQLINPMPAYKSYTWESGISCSL